LTCPNTRTCAVPRTTNRAGCIDVGHKRINDL
jgi:hypothetical protein